MAIKKLQHPLEWGFDDVTQEILLLLRLEEPDGSVEPSEYRPTREAVVRLKIASVNVRNIQ